ncbi:hypothetical protein P152DRAFT_513577 [Eremomyces bilateralis CBS 781.70]|uniref:Uncharacterized protein n=1 Tax=Eremomyces bilateralis CBS 781.70 TaxID=1392243 RepID=A0A6G1G5P7_9PEZI|nr:uncharacterized protein P152DRAFT_513577 [Eremomyces bilateralis CBS 781.70]KAF1813332.1 hypothetical protein P152DRAFT_513577 [Eremomyces bilateralis CBS 781.70]
MADIQATHRQQRKTRPQKQPPQGLAALLQAERDNKKRKAPSDDNDAPTDSRKKSKADVPASPPQERKEDEAEAVTTAAPIAPAHPVDEDEWAAFERDVATPPPQLSPTSAPTHPLTAHATIAAAPVTASELTAQEREKPAGEMRRRDAETAAEQEDAVVALEEEFEEMRRLEGRVRRLRERREEVRRGVVEGREVVEEVVVEEVVEKEVVEDEEEEDEEYDDEWDNLGFRPG